jgi:streptogramin lyase
MEVYMHRLFWLGLAVLSLMFVAAGGPTQAHPAGLGSRPSALLTEFPLPPNTGPWKITNGPNGNLWFSATSNGGAIGQISPTGVITLYPLNDPTGDSPNGIVAGPDGNLWFAYGYRGVGRITPTGVITTFAEPTNADAYDIAAGPDGNLWVTDANGSILRYTPAGTFTQFTLTTPGNPHGITAGPDGNLWFGAWADRIGRITPAGVISEFSLPSGMGAPEALTSGPDGNLWFTEWEHIGRVTPAGVVTEFAESDDPFVAGFGITTGPDGNLWFTHYTSGSGRLGRSTPQGVITAYIAGDTGLPAGIVTGPDGNLWFTENGTQQIARLDITGLTPEPSFTPTPTGGTTSPTATATLTAMPTTGTATASVTATATPTYIPPACDLAWRRVAVPATGHLYDVVAFSPGDVWIGGDQGLWHWDGTTWAAGGSGAPTLVTHMVGGAPNSLWVTAGQQLWHWDGTAWSVSAYPTPTPPNNAFVANVAAAGPSSAWIGGSGTGFYDLLFGWLDHWDGSAWHVIYSPPYGAGPGKGVPQGGCYRGDSYNGLWAIGPNDLWLSGTYDNICVYPAVHQVYLDHCTATGCDSSFTMQVTAVAGVAPDDVWAAAGSTFYHWNGTTWTSVSGPDLGVVTKMAAPGANDVWAIGSTGIAHWNGTAWARVAAPPGSIAGVSADAANDAWLVGTGYAGDALVAHWSAGPGCTPTPTPVTTPPACPATWADVPAGSGFYAPVTDLACRGIVGGYPCGGVNPQTGQPEPCTGGAGTAPANSPPYYRPNNSVNRGQAAKIITLSAGLSGRGSRQTFADVPPTNVFFAPVEALAAAGLANGYRCGSTGEPCDDQNRPYFRPSAYITRGQLAKLIAGAAAYSDTPPGQLFADVLPSSAFYTWVQQVGSRGIIGGYACGGPGEPCDSANRPYYRPVTTASRGQTAKIDNGVFFP